MSKKIILFSFLLILLSSFASAIDFQDTSNRLYYSFDNDDISSGNPLDLTPNNNDGINNGATTGVNGVLNEAFSFDGINDYINITNLALNTDTSNFSVSFWINTTENDGGTFTSLIENIDSTSRGWAIRKQNNKIRVIWGENAGVSGTRTYGDSTITINDGNWHNVIVTWDNAGGTHKIYIDNVDRTGSLVDSNADGDNLNTNRNPIIGAFNGASNFFSGSIDEVSFWYDKTLNSSERTFLYNSGSPNSSQQYPFQTVFGINESLESTLMRNQLSNVTIAGSSFQTIISDVFTIANVTPGYMSVSTTTSGGSGTAECRINLDGLTYNSTVQRTNVAGQVGNLYSTSSGVNFSVGEHTVAFECRKVGGANYVVSNSVGIIHFQLDEQNETINRKHVDFTETTNSSSFQLLNSYNFTIQNKNFSDDIVNNMIIDWSATYTNNNGSTELNTYFELVGYKNCSQYPRYVLSSGIASVSGDCLLENLSANEVVTVNVYGLGNNSEYDFNIHNKNFYMGSDEANSVQFNSTSNKTSNFTLLLSLPINNTHHDNNNVFSKLTVSTKGNITGTIQGYATMRDGGFSQNTTIFSRSVTNEYGVAIFQWVFENVSTDNYTIDIYSRCVEGDCELNSVGTFIAYLTDVTPTESNAFNLSVFDNYDNSSIDTFNVTIQSTGAVFSATNGWALIFSTMDEENLTIQSGFNGGYFSTTIIDHNTSNDLDVFLNQTYINWDCFEKVSGLDLSCTSPTEITIFNYNVVGNPHTQSVNVTGYYERLITFNVSALENETKNVSFYSTNLTMQSVLYNGSQVNNCDYNITGVTYPSYTEVVRGSPNSSVGLINGSYTITADCDSFAFSTENVTIENITQTLIFTLFTSRSVNFTFYDEDSPSTLLSGVNISFALLNGGAEDFSTNVGYEFVQGLSIADYEIRYSAPGYTDKTFFFSVTNRSTQILQLYLTNDSLTSQVLTQVRDLSDAAVSQAVVRLQRQSISMNGSFITIDECETNDDGDCFMDIQESTSIVYRFVILVDDEVIKTTTPDKILFLEGTSKIIKITIDIGSNLIESLQRELGILGTLVVNQTTNISTYEFIDSSNSITRGCLVIKKRDIPGFFYETVSESCVNSQTGIINTDYSGFIENNTELLFEGVVDFNPGRQVIITKSISNQVRGSNILENDNIIFTIIVFAFIAFAVVLIPSLIVQILLDFALMIGVFVLGFNLIGIPVIMLFMVLGIIIAWDRKSSRGGGV